MTNHKLIVHSEIFLETLTFKCLVILLKQFKLVKLSHAIIPYDFVGDFSKCSQKMLSDMGKKS